MTPAALLLVCALAISGCGSSSGEDPANVELAYLNLEKALIKGDGSACSMMTSDYQNKLAASTQLFADDCPTVVKEVAKHFKSDPDLKTTSIDQVKVNGETASLIAHSRYEGKDVRVRAELVRANDGWKLNKDRQLDAVAPDAPLAAYDSYIKAFAKGDGKRACALSTDAARALTVGAVPQSHGGGDCEGAVPYLSLAARKVERADLVGGDVEGDSASLYTLQSDGQGSWTFRVVVMKREDGEWLYDHAQDLGTAPKSGLQGGPVA